MNLLESTEVYILIYEFNKKIQNQICLQQHNSLKYSSTNNSHAHFSPEAFEERSSKIRFPRLQMNEMGREWFLDLIFLDKI